MLGDTVIPLSTFISSGDFSPTFAFCCCILVCNNIYYLIPWRCGGRLGGWDGGWATPLGLSMVAVELVQSSSSLHVKLSSAPKTWGLVLWGGGGGQGLATRVVSQSVVFMRGGQSACIRVLLN